MKRRKAGLILLVLFAFVFGITGYKNATKQHAKATKQPDHNLVFDSNRMGNYEIFTITTTGEVSQLSNDQNYDSWWPKASPDGKNLIFYRTPKGVHDKDYAKTSLWIMNSKGENIQLLIPDDGYGWAVHGHAEWSPDGKNLIMFGAMGELFITDINGKNPNKISVSGQSSGITDPAWSPDGNTIVYAFQNEIWKVSRSGGTPSRLTNDTVDDYDPYFSPDGNNIAFLTHTSSNIISDWAIRRMNANGTDIKYLINDGNINSKPEWSPDGQTIYFHRHPNGTGSGFFGIWFIDKEGNNLTAVDVGGGSSEYPDIINVDPGVSTGGGAPSSPSPSPQSSAVSNSSQNSNRSPTPYNPGNESSTSGSVASNNDEYSPQNSAKEVSPPASTKKKWKALLLLVPPLIIAAIIVYLKKRSGLSGGSVS